MTNEQFIDYLESAGADIRTDYSGRAMFGDTCVGFGVENTGDALQIIAEQEDRSVSDCIRQAVKQYVSRMLK